MFDDFIRAENIRKFQNLLQIETDPAKLKMLVYLLTEEQAGRLSPSPAR